MLANARYKMPGTWYHASVDHPKSATLASQQSPAYGLASKTGIAARRIRNNTVQETLSNFLFLKTLSRPPIRGDLTEVPPSGGLGGLISKILEPGAFNGHNRKPLLEPVFHPN